MVCLYSVTCETTIFAMRKPCAIACNVSASHSDGFVIVCRGLSETWRFGYWMQSAAGADLA